MLPFSCRSLLDGEQTEDPAVQDDEDEVHHPEDDADADEADDRRKDLAVFEAGQKPEDPRRDRDDRKDDRQDARQAEIVFALSFFCHKLPPVLLSKRPFLCDHYTTAPFAYQYGAANFVGLFFSGNMHPMQY